MKKNIKVDFKKLLSAPDLLEHTLKESVKIASSIERQSFPSSEAKYYTSHEYLDTIDKNINVSEHKNLSDFKSLELNKKLIHHLMELYPRCSIVPSGHFLYPKEGGFMSWHTNADYACKRVYITYVEEPNKSFFRYKDGDEIVTSWDDERIVVREFDVNKEPPYFWHCVYSETNRYSFGYRIIQL